MTLKESTYYILDAQGNPLATYVFNAAGGPTSYYLTERNIYGSDRLGMTRDTVNMFNPNTLPSYGVLGNRNYELKNHLGNVLAVINDFNIPQDENSDNTVDTYHAGIESIYDYSPFGVQLNGRTIERQYVSPPPDTTYSTGTAYLDSSNFENPTVVMSGSDTMFIDGWTHWVTTSDITLATISGSQWMRINSRHGAAGARKSFTVTPGTTYTLSIDLYRNQSTPPPPIEWPPIESSFATNNTQNLNEQYGLADSTGTSSPLNTSTNAFGGASMNTLSSVPSVVNIVIWESATGGSGVGTTVYQMFNDGTNTFTYTAVSEDIFIQIRQSGVYYLDNIILSYPDTTALITQAPTPKNYRYGYQGSEKDNEVKGSGNSYTTHFRQLDPRLGRWLTIDPKATAWESPYVSMGNNPIWHNDVLGDSIQIKSYNGTKNNGSGGFDLLTYKSTEKGGIGFYTESGELYSGDSKFVKDVNRALARISLGKEGNTLVTKLMNDKTNFIIEQTTKGNQTNASNGDIAWNPNSIIGGFNQNKNRSTRPWVSLAHELGHTYSILNNVSVPEGQWDDNIEWDEINASHWENKIRSENGLPLRTYYGVYKNPVTGEESPNINTPLLFYGTDKSLYFDLQEKVNYHGLKNKENAYSY